MTGRSKHLLINLCMCTSLMRCTPERGESVSAVAGVPATLQRWVTRASETGRSVVRPLQALRSVAGALGGS